MQEGDFGKRAVMKYLCSKCRWGAGADGVMLWKCPQRTVTAHRVAMLPAQSLGCRGRCTPWRVPGNVRSHHMRYWRIVSRVYRWL